MDSSEKGMNPVAMTNINPQKAYWQSQGSNQRPPVSSSVNIPTEQITRGVATDSTEHAL